MSCISAGYPLDSQPRGSCEAALEIGRTTAAVYLAGYSIEYMLKALILPAIPQAQEEEVLSMFRGARAHDCEWLLRLYVEKGGARMPPSVAPHFTRVNLWSTDMRHVSGTIARREAHALVDAATAILTWLRWTVVTMARRDN